jgi:hypothetical protein
VGRPGKRNFSERLEIFREFNEGGRIETIDIKGGLQLSFRSLGSAGEKGERRKKKEERRKKEEGGRKTIHERYYTGGL